MRLREARVDKHLTARQLAAHLGVTVGSVWHWESGRKIASQVHAQRLAALLRVDEDEVDEIATAIAASKRGRNRPAAGG